MPNGSHPVALADMNLPQLAELLDGLAKLEEQYENMSGICATLRGLLLIETKRKLGHGKFTPFLKEHFPKSLKSAQRYMRIAEQCLLQKRQSVVFESLTDDLASSVLALRQFNLDLSHPAVAEIAGWVAGRGAYQLMLDFPCGKGGDTSGTHKQLTAAEERAKFLKDCQEEFESTIMALDRLHEKALWQAESITDAHREAAAELAREFARSIADFLKTPARKRDQ